MKKKQILFTLIVILLIYSINNPIGNAYPGDGDCQDYHTIAPIEVPRDNSANIILNGVENE
ncbi:MAG: hypothetical protein ACTSRT_21780 [Promethearchaeota archaeon]